jgi:TPR repeat protein
MPNSSLCFTRWASIALLGLLTFSPVGASAGMSPEEVKVFKDYESKALLGDAASQYELGDCYHLGIGVRRDDSEAFFWYRKGAEKGNLKAQWSMGWCYYYAIGVAKDYVQAVEWYRKAAEQGDVMAQANLAECYKKGIGVLKDEVEALAYYSLAAMTNDGARMYRDLLEKEMSPAAREAGYKRAKALQKEIEAKIAAKKAGK